VTELSTEEVRSYCKEEVKYRAAKRWEILSWASTLLVVTIAGGIASKLVKPTPCEKLALCVAVIFLGGYAIGWLKQNDDYLQAALKEIPRPDLRVDRPRYLSVFSYEGTVVVLTAVAVVIILIAHP
jgi:hypothetical protein